MADILILGVKKTSRCNVDTLNSNASIQIVLTGLHTFLFVKL